MNNFSESFSKIIARQKYKNKTDKGWTNKDFTSSSSIIDIDPLQPSATSLNTVAIDIFNETNVDVLVKSNGEINEITKTIESRKLDDECLKDFNESYGKIQKSILIELKLECGCIFLWKNKKIEKLLQLNLKANAEELYELVKKFIKKSLERDYLGIAENLIEDDKWMFIKQLDLTQLIDSDGHNLLFFAAEINSINLIKDLVQNGFSVNDCVNSDFPADIAWRNKNYEFLAVLLNNNSQFPNEFQNYNGNCEEFPESLRDFLKITRDFNEALDDGNEARLKEIIESHRNLRHFYQYANASAPLYALYKKNLQLYELLTINDIIFGPFEETSHIIQSLSSSDREKLEKIHLKYVKNLPEQHITALLANTHFGHDIDNLDEKRSYVEKAFYHLNSIAIVQMILKCIAASRKFKIIFDFNRDHVQFLNPTEAADSNGLFDQSIGRMSIAAKEMLKNETKDQVFGVIAHELCHYAMFLVYRNDGKPYHKGDKASERKFDKISVVCERRSKKEKLIDLVYECYDDFLWHAELIVRIPHMIALYHDQPEKMKSLRKIYKSLFDYYEGKVMRDMEEALPMIGLKEEKKIRKRKKENWILKILLILLLLAAPMLYIYRQRDHDKIGEMSSNTVPKNITVYDAEKFIKIGTYHDNTVPYTKNYYIPRKIRAKWTDALKICKTNGYQLASFETLNEFIIVQSFLNEFKDYLPDYTHIGAMTSKLGSRDDWHWVSTNEKINFPMTWFPGEPNNWNNEEDYLVLRQPGFTFSDMHNYHEDCSFLCAERI